MIKYGYLAREEWSMVRVEHLVEPRRAGLRGGSLGWMGRQGTRR